MTSKKMPNKTTEDTVNKNTALSKKATTELKERVEKLRKAIEKHRYNYHVLDKEDISQEALDSLKRELSEIEKEYPELVSHDSPSLRIAGEPLKEFKKITHKVAQWSFNDAFTEQDIKDFDARIKRVLEILTLNRPPLSMLLN
jgi:DNA ligase (NAD+)